MAKGKDTTAKPKANPKKDEAPKLQTIRNTTAQHRTVCVGKDAIPLPPGATAPLPEKAAAWCKQSAVVKAWVKEGMVVIQDVEDDVVESEEE